MVQSSYYYICIFIYWKKCWSSPSTNQFIHFCTPWKIVIVGFCKQKKSVPQLFGEARQPKTLYFTYTNVLEIFWSLFFYPPISSRDLCNKPWPWKERRKRCCRTHRTHEDSPHRVTDSTCWWIWVPLSAFISHIFEKLF